MATPYQEVYERFMPKITDYSFIKMNQEEVEENLETYLKSSIIKFRYCDKLSDRDELNKQFNEDLTDEEIEILANLMCVEYLTPKLLTDEFLKQRLSSKDYQLYSQANHIKEIKDLRNQFKKESNELMVLYTYTKNKVDDFV